MIVTLFDKVHFNFGDVGVDGDGIEFVEERLRSLIVESLHLTAHQLVERILTTLLNWQGDAPQYDDITLIVARVK